jgi:hypothetical protein
VKLAQAWDMSTSFFIRRMWQKPFFLVILLTISLSLALIGLTPFSAEAKILSLGELGLVSTKKLEQQGVTHIEPLKHPQTGQLSFRLIGKQGEVIKTIELKNWTKDELAEFRPSKIQSYFHILKTQSPHILKNKIKQFPMEAFSFFVAIGAVTTSELIFNFSKNPVAMSQFLQSQADPVGQLGFAAFIMANGVTSEPLMMVTQSPTLRYFIPYLGMSVGMMASNIVHEIGHFPHLWECAIQRTNCDKAYEAWLDYRFSEKWEQWAPGLISLVVSTAASGVLEIGIRAGAGAVIRWLGVELALSATPTGWAARAGRWVYKISQLAGFVYIDHLIYEPIHQAYQNAFGLSQRLQDSAARLSQSGLSVARWIPQDSRIPLCDLKRLRRKGESCEEDFAYRIFVWQRDMAHWFELNLSAVLMSHQNWLQFLSELAHSYQSHKSFYLDFVTHLWSTRYLYKNTQESVLAKTAPLFGVKLNAKDFPAPEEYLFRPNAVEKQQYEYLRSALDQLMRSKDWLAIKNQMSGTELRLWRVIEQGLVSERLEDIGRSLQHVRFILRKDVPLLREAQPLSSGKMYRLAQMIYSTLGEPKPLLAPGALYLSLSADPEEKQSKLQAQQMAWAMLRGEDSTQKNSSLVKTNWSGFAISLKAPRLVQNPPQVLSPQWSSINTPEHQWEPGWHKVQSAHGKTNAWLYLLTQVSPEAFGDSQGAGIERWWESRVDHSIRTALQKYQAEYNKIIENFRTLLLKQEDSWLNRTGGFSNNPLRLAEQSMDVHFSLLYLASPKAMSLKKSAPEESLLQLAKRILPELEREDRIIAQLRQAFYQQISDFKQALAREKALSLPDWQERWQMWLEAWQLKLSSTPNLGERDRQVLTQGVEQLIGQTVQWAEIFKTLDEQFFQDAKPDLKNLGTKCPPMSNGLGLFLRGACP